MIDSHLSERLDPEQFGTLLASYGINYTLIMAQVHSDTFPTLEMFDRIIEAATKTRDRLVRQLEKRRSTRNFQREDEDRKPGSSRRHRMWVNRMVSERKAKANAANASRSTGPKSASGKARSSRNAVRHGLSRGIQAGTPEAAAVAELSELLAEGSQDPEVLMHAAVIAECTVTLDHIARLRSIVSEGVPAPEKPTISDLVRYMDACGTAILASAGLKRSVAMYKAGADKGEDLAQVEILGAQAGAILRRAESGN